MLVAASVVLAGLIGSIKLVPTDSSKTGASICHENMINSYETHTNRACYDDYASFRLDMEAAGRSYGDWGDFCNTDISEATCASFNQRLMESRQIESCSPPEATMSQAEVQCAEALSACYYCNGLAYQGKGGNSPERDKRKCDCAGSEAVQEVGPLPPCIARALAGLDYFVSADGEESKTTQEAGVSWCREVVGETMDPLIMGFAIGLPASLLLGACLWVAYQSKMGLLGEEEEKADGSDEEGIAEPSLGSVVGSSSRRGVRIVPVETREIEEL